MELAAFEVHAHEVLVGDVMQHRTVTLSGGWGRVVEARVEDIEVVDGKLEFVLADGYAYAYRVNDVVVVYRPV
jgi:uncharacterized cupin superfamily protein